MFTYFLKERLKSKLRTITRYVKRNKQLEAEGKES